MRRLLKLAPEVDFQRGFLAFFDTVPSPLPLIPPSESDSQPVHLQVRKIYVQKAGLLTRSVYCAFPELPSGLCNKHFFRNLQQQVLFRIHTEFPFHPSTVEPLSGNLSTAKIDKKRYIVPSARKKPPIWAVFFSCRKFLQFYLDMFHTHTTPGVEDVECAVTPLDDAGVGVLADGALFERQRVFPLPAVGRNGYR